MSSNFLILVLCLAATWTSSHCLQLVVNNEEQIRWAMTVATSGDEILITNREIEVFDTISTLRSGNDDEPIVIKGTGPSTSLKFMTNQNRNKILFYVESGNWIFKDLELTGNFSQAVFIEPTGSNIQFENVRFIGQMWVDTIGLTTYGSNVSVSYCYFECQYVGVYINNVNQHDPETISVDVRNNVFVATGRHGQSNSRIGVYARGASLVHVRNNVFNTTNTQTAAWTNFVLLADVKEAFIAENEGRRAYQEGFMLWLAIVHFPVELQLYSLTSNHCDLQFNVWCIHAYQQSLFNQTNLNGNTFENGRGLTNIQTLHD